MPNFNIDDIGIVGVCGVVPPHVVSTEEYIPLFGEEAVMKFVKNTGIAERHVALPEQTASDLGVAATKELLRQKNLSPKEIGVLVFVTMSPDYRRPPTACVVHYQLELSMDCAAIEINLGCSGFVYALQVASAMLSACDKEFALIAMGEVPSKIIKENDKSVAMMFGDCGSAVLLQKKKEKRIRVSLKTDGSRFKSIILPGGGFRDMYPSEETFMCADGIERNLYNVFMDGMGVFSFSISDVPQTIREFLEYTQTTIQDYDVVVLHQPNKYILKQLLKKLGIPKEKAPIILGRYGNPGGSAIPLVLSDQLGTDNSQRKLNLLMSGFGVGLSWGVASASINTEDVFPIVETTYYFKKGKMTPKMLGGIEK